jgi:hypothetical protein
MLLLIGCFFDDFSFPLTASASSSLTLTAYDPDNQAAVVLSSSSVYLNHVVFAIMASGAVSVSSVSKVR